MTNLRPADLAAEAERYLALVEVFRAEGCEPHWRLEMTPPKRARLTASAGGGTDETDR